MEWRYAVLFYGNAMKQHFRELVRATDYAPGPPAAERPALVARLARELAELEEAETVLVDEAAGGRARHGAPSRGSSAPRDGAAPP